ncbi:MAG: quinolinate synthase NadA [Planctomycetota bacterium]|jgi:quinolinate synthase|nr:quinolinate synthase NadA [Planctomycetota bacterium]
MKNQELTLLEVPEPAEIRAWATENGITILAHSYQEGFLQEAAHFVGDSLELARYAAEANAKAICFCGVHFMAETAKLLSPEAEVFVPDMDAGCSLADSCKAEDLAAYKEHLTVKLGKRPTTVAYVNCTAAVKAQCDIICTSGNARQVVESIPEGEPILFVPDKHLGGWLNETLDREMILWDGACEVHELFSVDTLKDMQAEHPGAITISHPECPKPVRDASDYVLGTAGMLRLVKSREGETFIVGTEANMIYRFEKEAPQNTYLAAPGASCACNLCPYMQLNTPEKLWTSLHRRGPQVDVAEELRGPARKALERMLAVV